MTALRFTSVLTTSRLFRRDRLTDGRPSRKSPSSVGSAFLVRNFALAGALFGVAALSEDNFLFGVALARRLTAGDRRGVVDFL